MMFRGKIAAVSYLNTIPMIYGIEHADNLRATLLLSPPSRCAAAFSSGEADIALLPSGALSTLADAQIITSFCIGASAPVRTVVVMSNSPIEDVTDIYLDSHSMTSALLTHILCNELWCINPMWHQLDDYSKVDHPLRGEAFLLIGDKVFDYEGRFEYSYDLAMCWHTMTSLPFCFAVWVAKSTVAPEVIESMQSALNYGVAHIKEAIQYYGHSGKPYAYDYLTHNIDFVFDAQKRSALELYWQKGLKFAPRVNPG